LPGLFLEPVEIDSHISPYDLHATAIERDKQLVLGLEYRTDLFDDSTIARVLNHFQMLLERIVEDVDQPIATLPLVSEAETRQLLIDWNKSETSHLDDHCVHELFEHQAIRSQDSVAVVFNDQQITYKELNNKANQLAHYLLKLGVGSDILVGLYLETSPEVIIALLAVHKAGSAYLPLDPNDPLQRLLHISNETKLAVLLSQRSLAESFPEHIAKVICLDSEWPTIAQESENNPGLKVAPTNLAYVIYTSGSTGLPKGVEIEHRSLTNFTRWAMTAYELAPTDRVLQFASLSTDTAVEEIFPCLLSGATLVLRTDSMLRSLPGFLQGCREARVTVLDLPTGYWHELVDEVSTGPRTNLGNLRLVIIGGEQASAARLVRWRGWAGQESRLINTYGPTEATVVSTYWEADDSLKEAHSRSILPIGRPITNTQLYVLDDYLNPVPMGVRGEIYIGGLGLARGYLKSPELNTEKFVTHPFSTKLGARLYKTGDLARYRPDGNLEFLGRIDNQIKIRGYRVELHEIEAVLCQHGSVKDAVALAPENMPAYQRLVAYVVPNQFVAPTASELRSFLNATLPDYMVPSGFVLLETLPLTPNGKVDRQMLSTLDRPELKDGFVAPRTPDEKIMANIWAETLKLKQISLYDNFFDLGRHSFLAMEVISRVRKVFGIDVPFRELFAVPTVAGMAATMMRKRSMHQSVHHVNGQSNGS
jgi:amino acid adenylation domain-containing protein